MAIDFGGLATTDNYSTAYTPKINEAVKALAYMLDPAYASYTGTPFTGAKRLSSASGMQMFNGTSWVSLSYPGSFTTLSATGNITGSDLQISGNSLALLAGSAASTIELNYAGKSNATFNFRNGSAGLMAAISSTGLSVTGTLSATGAVTGAGLVTTGAASIILNNSDNTNYYYIQNSGASGAGNPVLDFVQGGVGTRLKLDTSGNLGLGVTPSAWSSGYKILELPGSFSMLAAVGTPQGIVTTNAYLDSVGWKYKQSFAATLYQTIDGVHRWYTAPSGTAGAAITFTQAMALDASGRWMVGSVSPINNAMATAYAASGSNGFVAQVANNVYSLFQGFNASSANVFRVDGNGNLTVTGSIAGVHIVAGDTGSIRVGGNSSTGYVSAIPGNAANTGYFEFTSAAGVRQGYIGFSGSTASSDTGTIPYVAGTHNLIGRAYTSPSSTAYSAALTVDALGSNFIVVGALTGNITSLTIQNALEGQFITIRFTQDGTGGRTITTGNMGATNAPSIQGTPTTTAGKSSYLNITYNATAARWEGSWLGTT